MKAIIRYILLGAGLMLCAACDKDDSRDSNGPPATLSLKLMLGETTLTKSMPEINETGVTDINIFAYDEITGHLISCGYFNEPSGNVELGVYAGRSYAVYAVANAGDLTGSSGITDSLGLIALTWTLESPEGIVNSTGAIPMSGRKHNVKAGGNSPEQIVLTRMLAKFRIIADISGLNRDVSSFDIKKVMIKNMNRRMGYFTTSRAMTGAHVFTEGLCIEGDGLKRLMTDGVDIYLPENAQGDLLASNVDESTHIPPDPYDGLCTYVELHVDYRSKEHYSDSLVYRYYLHDGRRLDNFDLLRNTMYTCRTKFTGSGINESSWRIDVSGMKDLVTSISITPEKHTFKDAGETLQYSAKVLPISAENPTVTWSSDNEDVATVDADGTVTAVGDGTCSITATATDGSGVSGSAVAIVDTYKFPSSVTVTPDKAEMYAGDRLNLSAKVLPDNANDKSVIWSSSDKGVATVSESGTVSAISAGTVMIIASTTANSLKDTAVITVRNKTFRLGSLPDILYPGYNSPVEITYTAVPSATPSFSLKVNSGKSSGASVSGSLLTASNPGVSSGEIGAYTLTATANGITVTHDFSVSAGKITLPSNPATMYPGRAVKLKPAELSPADISVSWSSSDPGIATVSSDGTVTPIAPGKCTIYATTAAGAEASTSITVSVPELVFADGIVRIYEGENKTLSTNFIPAISYPVEYSVVSGGEYVSVSGSTISGVKRSNGKPNPVIQVRYRDFPDIYKRAEVTVLPCLSASRKGNGFVVNTNGHTSNGSNWNSVISSVPLIVEHAPHVTVNWEIRNSDGELCPGYFKVDSDFKVTPSSPDATGKFTLIGWDQTHRYSTEPIVIESYQMLEYEVGLKEYGFSNIGNVEYYIVSLSARWSTNSWNFMSGLLKNMFMQQKLIMHKKDHPEYSNIGSNGGNETFIEDYLTSVRRSGGGIISDLNRLAPFSWIRSSMDDGAEAVQGLTGAFLIFNTEDHGFSGYYYIKQRNEIYYNAGDYTGVN